MNKGIIMDIKKNYAIAMNDEGIMDKIVFKDNMKVGQKIFYFEDDIVRNASNNVHWHHNFMKSFGSIAALFLIVFTMFHIMKPQEAYAVVSLDINPSIQIEADSKFNIIKVEGVNDDGKKMDFSDIKNIPLESGIQKIKDKLVQSKYLVTNKDILVGYAFVQSGEDNSAYEKDLMGAINSTFSTEQVTFVPGDKEGVNKAKEQGISLGRYEAASRVTNQDIKNKIGTAPVKDITASIKDNQSSVEWNAKDEQQNVPAVNETSEVKSEKPVIDKQQPNASSDTTELASDSDKKNDKIDNKPDNNDGVLNLQPDVPVQSENNIDNNNSSNNGNSSSNGNSNSNSNSGSNSTVQTTPKDNTINIVPNNGTIENNTTSGKINEDSNKVITPETSKSIDKNTKN